MPRVYNLGSINMDQIIRLPHFPSPGETISGALGGVALGGKGLNVSVALSRAGAEVVHIGAIGKDAADVVAALDHFGVDRSQIAELPEPSGTAYVFLDTSGENSIVVCPGANVAIPVSAHVHGDHEFGDLNVFPTQTEKSSVPATRKLVEAATEAPGQLTVCAIGPLTNIAGAIACEDLEQFTWEEHPLAVVTERDRVGEMIKADHAGRSCHILTEIDADALVSRYLSVMSTLD